MKTRIALLISIVVLAAISSGCATRQHSIRSNAFEYLYPDGSSGAPASSVALELPLRVGVAFAPGTYGNYALTGPGETELMKEIARKFEDREFVQRIEVIPGHYLSQGGGFRELDRLKTAFGIDLIALVSYDQHQFSDPGIGSLTYMTVVGAYVVKGDKQETVTLMDATVFDIDSEALLFRASGESRVKKRATGMGSERAWRESGYQGFELATTDLAESLDVALAEFSRQAASGTVRGKGTPKLSVTAAPGYTGGGLGAGAAGWMEIAALASLLAGAMVMKFRGWR